VSGIGASPRAMLRAAGTAVIVVPGKVEEGLRRVYLAREALEGGAPSSADGCACADGCAGDRSGCS